MKIYDENLQGLHKQARKQGISVEVLLNIAIGHYLIDCDELEREERQESEEE